MSEVIDSVQLHLLPKSNSGSSEQGPRLKAPNQKEGSSGSRLSRQDYNRKYYLMHKEKIQKKRRKNSQESVLHLFSKGSGNGSGGSRVIESVLHYIELVALIVLVTMMTYFLVTEAAAFYLDANESRLSAFLKAGMVEGIAVLFSFSKAKGLFLRWSQRSVVVLLSLLTVFTMCGKCFRTAVHDSAKSRTMSRAIEELESERRQKESVQQALISKGWIGATRRYEKTLDQIRQKLASARQEAAKIEAPHVIMNGLVILIAFRLLIVAANLICIHRVAEHLGLEARQKPEPVGP